MAASLVTALIGATALLLLPASDKSQAPLAQMQNTKADYSTIFGARAFWIMVAALFLCNFPNVLQLSQISLLLLENGVSTAHASIMLSALASGTLAGRFLCGAALDRFPAQLVAAIAMGLPTIGLLLFASSLDTPMVLTIAVLLIGLSFGAEGDLIGYIVARTFGTRIYSSVFGFMTATVTIGSAFGALALSYTLAVSNSYNLFLMISAAFVFIGSLLFLTLKPKQPAHAPIAALSPESV
jgi:predicted MFS family arabinose efflux permease